MRQFGEPSIKSSIYRPFNGDLISLRPDNGLLSLFLGIIQHSCVDLIAVQIARQHADEGMVSSVATRSTLHRTHIDDRLFHNRTDCKSSHARIDIVNGLLPHAVQYFSTDRLLNYD